MRHWATSRKVAVSIPVGVIGTLYEALGYKPEGRGFDPVGVTGTLHEALRYKAEDRGFDSCCCHWNTL